MIFAIIKTLVPIHVSDTLFVAAGVIFVFLPSEPQGKASL
jgi:hypothetical protein